MNTFIWWDQFEVKAESHLGLQTYKFLSWKLGYLNFKFAYWKRENKPQNGVSIVSSVGLALWFQLIKETGDSKVQSNYQFSTQYELESTKKSSINQFR